MVKKSGNSTLPRRGGVVSYADPSSGDDSPDAGEVDSDGSDFVASGGICTAIRAAHFTSPMVPLDGTPPPSAAAPASQTELDQSYLALIPPAHFIIAKPLAPTKHVDLTLRDAIEWGVNGGRFLREQMETPEDGSKDKSALAARDDEGQDWPGAWLGSDAKGGSGPAGAVEVGWREIERERASRRLRRETSKF
ncbi:hypothetical protein EDB89DRAFT_2168168 [Lactarius sanguifluus]|nr:hypothetical protein EDB89DRAFT_2168168 [Lactarius sanguifluus]